MEGCAGNNPGIFYYMAVCHVGHNIPAEKGDRQGKIKNERRRGTEKNAGFSERSIRGSGAGKNG